MRKQFLAALGSVGLGAVLSLYPAARSQETAVDGGNGAEPQEGVEVLARGPVHEAFAEPSVRSPRPTPLIPKQPPNPIEEMPPDQKPEGANVTWIPGYWVWDEDRKDFIWESGIWRDLPPDRQWVPGYWNQVEGGWQWVSGYWNVQAQETVDYLPAPPDPIAESVAPAPDAESTYVPGTWVFYQTRYMWRPGFWNRNRPGWIWTPAYYRWTPAGYIFVDGYWDYPFADRGLLFAPVFINQSYWSRPSWFYRPHYVVGDTFLLGSLFIRLDYSRYYFGDYFDAGYSGAGFIPWVDFRFGRTIPDPLFSYYRWHYASNPRWEADMRQLYVTRRQDAASRPPRTFAQITAAPATALAKPGTFASIQTATPLTPLTKVGATGIKLQTVPKAQLTQIRQAAVETHNYGKQRGQVEAKAFSQGQSTPKPGQPLKVELPKTGRPAVVQTPGAPAATPKTPPPRPEHPKAEARPAPKPAPTTPSGPRPSTGQQVTPKVEPKIEPKAEPKSAPKVEPKPAPKVEPKAEPKPAPRVEPKAEPKPPPPPPRVEPKPAPAPAPAPREEKDKNKKEKG